MPRCELCRSTKRDDIQFGEFLHSKSVSVHEYCLYLSSGLSQNGKDDEDIQGFLISDLKREKQRISKVKCCYCGQAYASIGCCAVKCYRNFHLPCGTKHGAKFEFISTFKSFCDRHFKAADKVLPKHDEICCICYDQLQPDQARFNRVNMLRAPCCKNGWFHKGCLQKFAKTSGYFFKCPLCNDTDKFRERLCYNGIFIPNRDAEWEMEPNAFAELLERPNNCAAENCRSYRTSENNPLVFCTTCGSVAMHKLCLFQNEQSSQFECAECKQLLQRHNDSGTSTIQCDIEIKEEEDDSDIDVCNDSETSETFAMEIDQNTSVAADEKHKFESKNNSTCNSLEEENEEELEHISKNLKCSQVIVDESNDDELLLKEDDFFSTKENNTPSTRQLNESFDNMVHKCKVINDSGNEINANSSPISIRTNTDIKIDINHNSQNQSDDDDDTSSDDPLYDFERCLKKKAAEEVNNIDTDNDEIKVASYTMQQRKRNANFIMLNSSSYGSSCHSTPTKKEESPKYKSTQPKRPRSELDQNETILREESERSQLNTSFIANRTRRKSFYIESSSFATSSAAEEESDETINNSFPENSPPCNSLSISCIANRTRKRKSRSLYRIDEQNENDSTKYESFQSAVSNHTNSSGSSRSDSDFIYTSGTESSSLSSSLSSSASILFSPSKRRKSRVLVKRLASATTIQQRLLSSSDDDEPYSLRRSRRRSSAASTYAAKLPNNTSHFDPYLPPKFTRVNGKLKRCT